MCLDKYVRFPVGYSLSGTNTTSKWYTIKWGQGRNSFSNLTLFSIGSSHSLVDTRLYSVSHPLFLISQSIWHVSLYIFCCLFVRFFKHVCPCQWHHEIDILCWFKVHIHQTIKMLVLFETVLILSPPCPHICWMCLPVSMACPSIHWQAVKLIYRLNR